MGKFIQRSLNAIVEPIKAEEVRIESTTQEIIKYIEVPTEKIIQTVKEIPVEVIREVKVIEEKIVQVPVEVIKYVDREVEKIVHISTPQPFEVVKEVEKKIVTYVHKVPYYCWMVMALEALVITLLIIK